MYGCAAGRRWRAIFGRFVALRAGQPCVSCAEQINIRRSPTQHTVPRVAYWPSLHAELLQAQAAAAAASSQA
eukprot:SAG11_NODE_991_length_6262_cov_12.112607_7_plen_72_part_00